MAQSLRSMSTSEKQKIIIKRLKADKDHRGLGYWAAFDARKNHKV